jgi:5-methylcytosine-specific restriction endonuclease McrA
MLRSASAANCARRSTTKERDWERVQMSHNRRYDTYSKPQPMGTNGRKACLLCGGDITDLQRRTFCSRKCARDFRLLTDPNQVRIELMRRDNGICAKCGVDSLASSPAFSKSRRGRGSGHLWQADHIVPVIEGGGECGLENYRTLCTACHKAETAALARRRAEARKPRARQVFDFEPAPQSRP